jgi:hypothetical protein
LAKPPRSLGDASSVQYVVGREEGELNDSAAL